MLQVSLEGGDGECQGGHGGDNQSSSVSAEVESSCKSGDHEDVQIKRESGDIQVSLKSWAP